MTIAEMHLNLGIVVDKLDTASYPDLPYEIKDWALNESQERFIKSRCDRNNLYRKGFQEIQRRTDDLNNITKEIVIVPTLVRSKVYKVNLSGTLTDGNKYMFYLDDGEAEVAKTGCAATYVEVTEIPTHQVKEVLRDPFNKPDILNPIIEFKDGGIYIHTDGSFTVSRFRMSYIKRPAQMSLADEIDCELAEHTHNEIVNLAGSILLEEVESGRLNQFEALKDKTE